MILGAHAALIAGVLNSTIQIPPAPPTRAVRVLVLAQVPVTPSRAREPLPPLVPPAEPISRRLTIDAKVPSTHEAAFAITVPSADELARRPVVARPPTEVVANVDVDRLRGECRGQYPTEDALLDGGSEAISLTVGVNAAGDVVDVRVLSSSGRAVVDGAVASCIAARLHIAPLGNGDPDQTRWVPIVWPAH